MADRPLREMSQDELRAWARAEADAARRHFLEKRGGRPLRPDEVNPRKWSDPVQLELVGQRFPLEPGSPWQITVNGEPGRWEVAGRRRVADGGSDAVVLRRGDRMMAARYAGVPEGWGPGNEFVHVATREREVPVLVWAVPVDGEPLRGPVEPTAATARPLDEETPRRSPAREGRPG